MLLRRWLTLFAIGFLALSTSAGALAAGDAPSAPPALAGTGFTYQGELQNGSGLVSATCDFRFSLFDAVTTGTQQGASQTVSGVAVAGGRFTVLLNAAGQFGARAFDGSARWLAVEVKCPGDSGFNLLSPRQPLTAAPLALALPGLRTEQNITSTNVIGGNPNNSVTSGVYAATISGGGNAGFLNTVTGNFGTVGGGENNHSADHGTVGGGGGNQASSTNSSVGGGLVNTASGGSSTVAGGFNNSASNAFSSVGGGNTNSANGDTSTVGGGFSNSAGGSTSTVGGGFDNSASGANSTVAGGNSNHATGAQSTIGGGLSNTTSFTNTTVSGGVNNTASNDAATVGGGSLNTASGSRAVVAGGSANHATNFYASIGGGNTNTASAQGATVSGGENNTASDSDAAVIGGRNNLADGSYSAVLGGQNNQATAYESFALGDGVRAINDGSFAWADSTDTVISTTHDNEFMVRASGGITLYSNANATSGVFVAPGSGSWNSVSDRNMKANFSAVDGLQVLNALAGIPVETWNYKTEAASIRHIGPMAQDFQAAFQVGEDNTSISTVDAQGVALAAIQGLYGLVKTQDAEISTLRDTAASQQDQISALSARVTALEGGAAPAAPAAAAPNTALLLVLALMAGVVAGGGLCLGAFALGRAKRA